MIYESRPSLTSRVGKVILLIWCALSGAAVLFVLTLGSNCPYADEWEFVSVLVNQEPVLPWLWQQHNEHRLPLPRIIYFGLFQITHDFRAGMLLQVAMLSGLSFASMKLAAKLRGRAAWADLFFPISLLHVGHWENLLMGYQICFTLIAILTTLIGIIALRTREENGFHSGWIASILAGLLMLCGGPGLIVALTTGMWIAWLARSQLKQARNDRAIFLFTLAIIPFLYIIPYIEGYQRPAHHPLPDANSNPVLGVAMVTGETVAMSFGIGCASLWWLVDLGILAIVVLTLREIMTKSSLLSPQSTGMISVLGGVMAIALAIGFGRAGFGNDMGLWSRYSLLTWPAIGLLFLFWVKRGGKTGGWMTLALCASAAFFFPTNTLTGLSNGSAARSSLMQIEAEAKRGIEPSAIIQLFPGTAQSGQEMRAVKGIPLLWPRNPGAFERR